MNTNLNPFKLHSFDLQYDLLGSSLGHQLGIPNYSHLFLLDLSIPSQVGLLRDAKTLSSLQMICYVLFYFQESEDHVFLKTITMKEVLLDMRSTGALKRVFTGAEFVEALLANNLWIQQFGVDESQNDFENAIALGKC